MADNPFVLQIKYKSIQYQKLQLGEALDLRQLAYNGCIKNTWHITIFGQPAITIQTYADIMVVN